MDLVQDILIVVRVLLVKHNIYIIKHHVILVHLVNLLETRGVRIQIKRQINMAQLRVFTVLLGIMCPILEIDVITVWPEQFMILLQIVVLIARLVKLQRQLALKNRAQYAQRANIKMQTELNVFGVQLENITRILVEMPVMIVQPADIHIILDVLDVVNVHWANIKIQQAIPVVKIAKQAGIKM